MYKNNMKEKIVLIFIQKNYEIVFFCKNILYFGKNL